MDKSDYDAKMQDLLSDPETYKRLENTDWSDQTSNCRLSSSTKRPESCSEARQTKAIFSKNTGDSKDERTA